MENRHVYEEKEIEDVLAKAKSLVEDSDDLFKELAALKIDVMVQNKKHSISILTNTAVVPKSTLKAAFSSLKEEVVSCKAVATRQAFLDEVNRQDSGEHARFLNSLADSVNSLREAYGAAKVDPSQESIAELDTIVGEIEHVIEDITAEFVFTPSVSPTENKKSPDNKTEEKDSPSVKINVPYTLRDKFKEQYNAGGRKLSYFVPLAASVRNLLMTDLLPRADENIFDAPYEKDLHRRPAKLSVQLSSPRKGAVAEGGMFSPRARRSPVGAPAMLARDFDTGGEKAGNAFRLVFKVLNGVKNNEHNESAEKDLAKLKENIINDFTVAIHLLKKTQQSFSQFILNSTDGNSYPKESLTRAGASMGTLIGHAQNYHNNFPKHAAVYTAGIGADLATSLGEKIKELQETCGQIKGVLQKCLEERQEKKHVELSSPKGPGRPA